MISEVQRIGFVLDCNRDISISSVLSRPKTTDAYNSIGLINESKGLSCKPIGVLKFLIFTYKA